MATCSQLQAAEQSKLFLDVADASLETIGNDDAPVRELLRGLTTVADRNEKGNPDSRKYAAARAWSRLPARSYCEDPMLELKELVPMVLRPICSMILWLVVEVVVVDDV